MQPTEGISSRQRRNRAVVIAVASACALVIAAAVTASVLVIRTPDSPTEAPPTPPNVDGLVRTMTGHDGTASFVHWSPDGTGLASVGGFDHTVRIWDPTTGATLLTLPGDGASWSADGTRVVTFGLDGAVAIVDAATGAELASFSQDAIVHRALLSPDGSLVATAGDVADTFTTVWEVTTGGEVAEFMGYPVGWLAGTSVLLVEHFDGAGLWDASSAKTTTHGSDASGLALSPDGTRYAGVTGSFDDVTVTIVDTATGAQLHRLDGDSDAWIDTVLWSPDGTRLATANDEGMVVIWDTATGEVVQSLPVGTRRPELAWSSDGRHVATFDWPLSRTVDIWDAATGARVQALDVAGSFENFATLEWSPDGTLIATGHSDGTVRLWAVD